METKTRADQKKEDCWNVEALYPSLNDWEADFRKFKEKSNLNQFKGTLDQGPEQLAKALDLYFSIECHLDKLYTYSHLRHDEDIVEPNNKVAHDKAQALFHEFNQETAWLEPEILALPNEKDYLEAPALSKYRFHLEKIFRMKAHTLSADGEALVALAGKALQTPSKAFSAIHNADFDFGQIKDEKGKLHPLTHGSYGLFTNGTDRVLREGAFKQLHKKHLDYENTLCELLQGNIEKHVFHARARNFDSCLDAALYPHNIDTAVYRNLISTVHNHLGTLHSYMEKRKEWLGLDELHPYDINASLVANVQMPMSYEEAETIVVESVAPLGEEYQKLLTKGLVEERWVDRYENKNKRSGAYSSGCYVSPPYILMNYKSIMRDVFTLAHEAGHSMHSLLSHTHQPYHYHHYPIFLAEVASTFNEELLFNRLLENCQKPEERRFLIGQKIQDIHSTFFRQTLFAEFELFVHETVEKGQPLTPQLLKEKYVSLFKQYYGPALELDDELAAEWSRIPHFYYNFYVYQYATGISAALALHKRVTDGGDVERESYLNFLRGGCSQYPLDQLENAGVDMRQPRAVEAIIGRFDELLALMTKEC